MEEGRGDCDSEEGAGGRSRGDGIVLGLDCGGGYRNLHVMQWHGATHPHCATVSFLVLILCRSNVRCEPWGKWVHSSSLYYPQRPSTLNGRSRLEKNIFKGAAITA